MDPASMRPLGVGEILDLGIKIYRRRFGTLARAVAVVVVPVAIVNALVSLSVAGETEVDGGDAAAFAGAAVVSGLLGYIATQLATAASFQIVSGDYLDHAPTWQESLRSARSRLRSLIWLSILYGLALALGFILCILPGIYLGVVFSVAVPVLLFEEVKGKAALGRSRRLIEGRFWPAMGVLVVSIILSGTVSTAIQAVLLGIVSSGGDTVDAFAQAVASSISSILTTPFSAAVIAVLYFDAKVRKEGFDLELLAGSIGIEPRDGLPSPWVEERPGEGDQPPFWPPPPGWRPGA